MRANDLNSLLDAMSNGINTIQAANNGISAITKLVQSMQALTSQAQQTADTTVRATLASQFDSLLTQIDQLAADSGFNGINLLGGNDLTITMNPDATSNVVVSSYNDTTAGDLAINASQNAWAGTADITAASDNLKTALTTLRSQAQVAELQFVHRADPSGIHQRDGQHPAIQVLTALRWPTATKKARTCLPCKPASSFRPPPCRWLRRPIKTCCDCSNRRVQLTWPRRRVFRRARFTRPPQGAASNGSQSRAESR